MLKKILIVGLGAVGAVYASKIKEEYCVKVLVDLKRKNFYEENPTIINGAEYRFDFITPEEKEVFDLVFITTKNYNLDEVLKNLKGFVDKKTHIVSLLNGISSEKIIKNKYPEATVIPSYLICHSMMREGRNITHDGINKIFCASNNNLEHFFKQNNICYETKQDIYAALWQKFMLNICVNQLSSVTKKTFGELQKLHYIEDLFYKILEEVVQIAKCEGINNPEKLRKNAIKDFWKMLPDGKTSMLQDYENNRPTEIDSFAGEIIRLGEKHNIKTPYSNLFYYLLG